MFFAAFLLLMVGFPVAFTFGAVSIIFGFLYSVIDTMAYDGTFYEGLISGIDMFSFMPYRIFAIMKNTILIAVPLFIFMGVVLQKTKIAQDLLESMGQLFGNIRGGLAISTILVGSLLAASTGVVGASVIAMGVISLPVMLKYNYSASLSCGVICASGTLGQIIPPSIVLIILADVFQVSVGDLFSASIIPSILLVSSYIVYVLVYSYLNPTKAPAISSNVNLQTIKKALVSIVPTLGLILLVLGSILAGIATATESSSLGCVGALLLAICYRRFSWDIVISSAKEAMKISSMVFAVLIGATAFSLVFSYSGADMLVEELVGHLPGGVWGFVILSMAFIMFLGFFIDFVEISYIVVPILVPISASLGIDPIWFGVLIALNLQTSFLTPPFGFSLFYLRGVAPPSVKTSQIYKGVVPFIILQLGVLALVAIFGNKFI